MEFARRNKHKILKLHEEGCSSYEIAEKLGTYSTKILRALKYLGAKSRDYSEAQKLALEKGRSKHPTKGKKLDEQHKSKIGKSRSRAYNNLSEEEKRKISEMSKTKWNEMGEEKQAEIRELAMEAVREAGKSGSKAEKFIKNGLFDAGYTVESHKGNLVHGSKLEVDLYVKELKTAIEIDGPSHFEPIWGEDKLSKQQSADLVKQGILLNYGYAIVRVRQLDKHLSKTRIQVMLDAILDELKQIKEKFPPEGKRLIEIEVKDGKAKRLGS